METTLAQLAQDIGATVQGDGSKVVNRCARLEDATNTDVSFLANRRYAKHLQTTSAGGVILSAADAAEAPASLTVLVSDEPYFAYRNAMIKLHGFRKQPPPGISDKAWVDPSAKLGQDVCVQAFAFIDVRATIGDRVVIYPHCYVGADAIIGDDCVLYPSVTIYDRCVLGKRVTLHSGCVIGEDGFGYATHKGVHEKIPQTGNAVIEDDVELGACCTIDRAALGSTVVGRGSKFSNLVAIGHGSHVGPGNLLVAQVGLAGSVKTGKYVAMGGQAGVAGHLEIGDMVQVAAKAGVASDLPANGTYGGQPAMEFSETKRNILSMTRLPKLLSDFRALTKRVKKLEDDASK